jgi:DNA gyrase subunit B
MEIIARASRTHGFEIDFTINRKMIHKEVISEQTNEEETKPHVPEYIDEYTDSSVTMHFKRREKEGDLLIDLDLLRRPEFSELKKTAANLSAIARPPLVLKSDHGSETFATWVSLLDSVIEGARKGKHIQRYKGLGEMNPQQLWETTMDPKVRRLLKVSVEDAAGADLIFSILMGDEIDKRREFIESHALEVKELDV